MTVQTLTTLPGVLTEEEWSAKWGIQLTEKPQVFARLPRAGYNELPGINQSLIKPERTLAHTAEKLHGEEETKKEHFLHGNICHCDALEPDRFDDYYVVIPSDAPDRPTESQLKPPKPKKDGTISTGTAGFERYQDALSAKSWWESFDKQHAGKELISQKDFDCGIALAHALKNHPVLGGYLSADQRDGNEITLSYIDSQTGMRLKARLDMLRVLGSSQLWLGDVKTTHDAAPGPDHFGKSAVNCGYFFQAAFYVDAVFNCKRALEQLFNLPEGLLIGLPIVYEWIAIEKVKRPHYKFISRQECPDELLELGRQEYRKALNEFTASMLTGYFPGYSTEAVTMRIPAWGYRKIIDGLES